MNKKGSGNQRFPGLFFSKGKKKGVTQTEFNWIFIAIAGTIILLFFISMVIKQKSVSEEKSDIVIQRNLQAILTGAEISKQTENIISVPEKELRYDCEGFSIGSLSAFNPRIVFAPDLLKSKKRELIFYSLEWRVPFRITNFLYVTSPEIRYIIVDDDNILDDDGIANQLYDLLPEHINKEIFYYNNNQLFDKNNKKIKDENNYKIKIIFFDNINFDNINFNDINFPNTKDEDISIIKITGNIDEQSNIYFYKKDGTLEDNLPYLKKESVIAAVFSENSEIYKCNMAKAIQRLKKVYDIYEKRYDKLDDGYDTENNCKSLYTYSNYLAPDFTKYDKIYKNIEKLENENQKLQLYSCALIY